MTKAATRRQTEFQLVDLDVPLHERLAESIQEAIAAGIFKPGERLPTHRELTKRFGVAIGTVTRAIDTLSRRGVVRGEIGRGTFVLEPQATPFLGADVDLSVNAPAPVFKPDLLAHAAERAIRRACELPLGGYGDVTGWSTHRAALSRWLGGRLHVAPDEIIMTVGAQQGLALAFADLRRRMETIVTEPATFTGALAAARTCGLKPIAAPVDSEGFVPDELDRVLSESGAKAIYTTPVCQNPMGFETGRARRRDIVALCRRRGVAIVEDDVYGHYAKEPGLTYKDLAPDIVYYVNSLSKPLSPLLRVGVIVAPTQRRPAIAEALRAEIWSVPPLTGAIAAELIEAGTATRISTLLREEAVVRVGMAVDALSGLRSGIVYPDAAPAPHVWLPMPLAAAERVARRALERGVKVAPPSASVVDEATGSGLRLSILAAPSRTALKRGLDVVASILAEPDEHFV